MLKISIYSAAKGILIPCLEITKKLIKTIKLIKYSVDDILNKRLKAQYFLFI